MRETKRPNSEAFYRRSSSSSSCSLFFSFSRFLFLDMSGKTATIANRESFMSFITSSFVLGLVGEAGVKMMLQTYIYRFDLVCLSRTLFVLLLLLLLLLLLQGKYIFRQELIGERTDASCDKHLYVCVCLVLFLSQNICSYVFMAIYLYVAKLE